jgi:hypothetical protein
MSSRRQNDCGNFHVEPTFKIMKQRIEALLVFVIEMLPALLTVGFTVFVVLKNRQAPMEERRLLEWVLGLLALLATSLLVDRLTRLRRIEKFSRESHDILAKTSGHPSLDVLMQDRKSLPPLEERFTGSKRVMITGGSLFRLANEYIGLFEQRAKEGCVFQFILVAPDSTAAALVAEHIVYEIKDVATYSAHIQTAIKNLMTLKAQFPAQIEVRVVNYVPPFSMIICDPEKEHGSIRLELYTIAVPTRERPHLYIRKRVERKWFDFFMLQFEQLWTKGKQPTTPPALLKAGVTS